MNKKNKSFTLIELLIVIVIIGILAGVIMISTSSSIDKANIAKIKVFEESITNNLAANMISRWPLDEITGVAAPYKTPDTWGNNTGTLVGADGLPQLRPASECVTDGCFKFDGVDDYIHHSSITFSSTESWTTSHWLNWQGYGTNPAYVFYMGTGNTCNGLLLRNNSDNKFCLRNADCVYVCFPSDSSNAYYNKGWFYLTWVADSSGKLSLYVNGKFLQTITGNTATTFEQIGNGYNVSGGYLLKGLIDDVRIYNAALSSSQIKQNYITGLNSMFANGNISKEDYNKRINSLAYNN